MEDISKYTPETKLKVTLSAFADLMATFSIFSKIEPYKKLEKVMHEQIDDIYKNEGKNWKGYLAFKEIREEYIDSVRGDK